MKKFLLAVALMAAASMLAASVATATSEVHKVFVCKYVGKPGVDERLQTGNNPISVDSNATVGTWFNDAQGRSYVLAVDDTPPGPEGDPSVSECPAPQGPTETSAGVTFTDATCEAGVGVSYSNEDKVTYEVTSGSIAAGSSVTITATAKEGFTLGEGQSVFTHTFPAAPTDCEGEGVPLPVGVTFTEATCTTAPSFHLTKTNGLPFYNVEGPDFVNGLPVPGGTYTFTAIPVEGFVFVGQTVFVHTFAAAPTDCGGSHVVTGSAQVICDSGTKLYVLSGSVDGQAADSVNPATLPGNTKGVSNVVVTRGDTSVRTTVTTMGDCNPTPPSPNDVRPTSTATPPVAAPPVSKPAAKPVRKPAAKKAPKKQKTTAVKRKVVKKHAPSKKPQKAPKTL